jgi:glycosyltransferase involved in cell wall biosynthesis
MRIVIDLQGAQSVGSRTRGIGRYSSSLAQAMAARAGEHEVILALNGCFSDAVDEIQVAFDGLVDPKNIHVWYAAPGSLSAHGRRAQEKLYEAFLASLRPDVVHVASLFEGLGDASVTSVGQFATLPTAVTLYDLIPLINPHPYLDNASVRTWYMGKVEALQRANMWLAISESSRQEGITQLDLDPERCINVSTAAYGHFRKTDLSVERQQQLKTNYGLNQPFVMYTGGIDHRKNLDGLIKAFALLPNDVRQSHQLAIVCSARPEDRTRLLQLAQSLGLPEGGVVVTGFVPEADLVDLYNLCKLFVFPSWHEGFGLPALEAMQSGAVVIGANTSSLPEVIGRDDALFDPRSEAAIAAKMNQALTDHGFRETLAQHGLAQAKKFSWDESARRALEGLEALHAYTLRNPVPAVRRQPRPRLAYVSPLPPERSGIADYSAQLLPELSRHYEIDLVTPLSNVEDPRLGNRFAVRNIDWFRQHSGEFDRVLYHFGNSDLHEHMFDLIAEIPGTVVLHDFFLGNIQAHREFASQRANSWTQALYASHGYPAVVDRFKAKELADVVFKYPCNFDVLRFAQGVIVHSEHSKQLARAWLGNHAADDWAVIPLLRALPAPSSSRRASARAELGLSEQDVLVCAFGMLGPTKLNHRLLQAWLSSSMARDPRCKLVFVGENDQGSYGAQIQQSVLGTQGQVTITGWAEQAVFQRYLQAADIAVQLRTLSRGETSAAVLDAMANEVATITNANGSMAGLPSDAVRMLPDDFSDAELIEALEDLRDSAPARLALARNGRASIQAAHAPETCARQYAEAIEALAARTKQGRDGLIKAIGKDDRLAAAELAEMAQAITASLPLPAPQRQLFVDVSELVRHDSRSGVQRLVRSLLQALFDSPPDGFRIEPVYSAVGQQGYKYARRFALKFLQCPPESLQDEWIDARRGDAFIGLDLSPQIVPEQGDFFRRLRHLGVRVDFVVYDLLPILLSSRFAPNLNEGHERWLRAVAENNGAICISQAVADELADWLARNVPTCNLARFKIRSFHLGADLASSRPTSGMPTQAAAVLENISARPSFLMVGTLEPRKGYEQVLKAFEHLWADRELEANLVIVGKQGWMVDDLVARLHQHPELGKRLFWLEGISDEYLEYVYGVCACLIAASEGEGFGLPLIEAARHDIPIIARDLPVFREVAGSHALYFSGDASAIAHSVAEWLQLFSEGRHPSSTKMPYLTWQESAEQFKAALLEGNAAGVRRSDDRQVP